MYIDIIKERKSVRTFDDNKIISEDIVNKIKDKIYSFKNPFNNDIYMNIYNKKEYDLVSNVICGEEYYIIGKVNKEFNYEIAYGYQLEHILLYIKSIGLDSVILASTYEKDNFIKAIDLKDNEVMPVVCPIGYKALEMSKKERTLRRFCKSDSREDIHELVLNYDSLMDYERIILKAVLLAPSARNMQPLKIIKDNNYYHFFIKHTKGFKNDIGDVQKIDLGIALAHIELAYKDYNKDVKFIRLDDIKDLDIDTDYQISVEVL